MKLEWNPNNSLTGNEFLDFLSWCEVVGIDFEEKKTENKEENSQQTNQELIKKMKGRDKYE